MREYLVNISLFVALISSLVSCGNREQKNDDNCIMSHKLNIESEIIEEYGKLMPGCKNILNAHVEGFDLANATIKIDNQAGEVYIEKERFVIIPNEAGNNIDLVVRYKDDKCITNFAVADNLPDPQVRFFNAETNEIQDYDIENIASVIVEMVGDDAFTRLFPEDSQYRILSFDAMLMRADEEVKIIFVKENYNSNQINISTLQDAARGDDIIVVHVHKAQRKDFKGEWHNIIIPRKASEIKLKLK